MTLNAFEFSKKELLKFIDELLVDDETVLVELDYKSSMEPVFEFGKIFPLDFDRNEVTILSIEMNGLRKSVG